MSCTCGLWTVNDVDGHLTIEKTLLTTNRPWSGQVSTWRGRWLPHAKWAGCQSNRASAALWHSAANFSWKASLFLEALRDRQLCSVLVEPLGTKGQLGRCWEESLGCLPEEGLPLYWKAVFSMSMHVYAIVWVGTVWQCFCAGDSTLKRSL